MNRLITAFLIPIVVLGNSIAHSHSLDAHSSLCHGQPHIHVGGVLSKSHVHRENSHSRKRHGHPHSHDASHEDHHHDENRQTATSNLPDDHDSDAIYLAATHLAVMSSDRILLESGSFDAGGIASHYPRMLHCDVQLVPPNDSPPIGYPLYLLHAALRL